MTLIAYDKIRFFIFNVIVLSVINSAHKSEFKPQSYTELTTELHKVANQRQMHLFMLFKV